jgi:hypothetical protein
MPSRLDDYIDHEGLQYIRGDADGKNLRVMLQCLRCGRLLGGEQLTFEGLGSLFLLQSESGSTFTSKLLLQSFASVGQGS